jgi:hypothetical protein
VNDPRIAVVGSGPSGLYTVAALLASGQPLRVDVIDRLPTPYGLVRYGVAPDHARMKAVTRVPAKPFAQDAAVSEAAGTVPNVAGRVVAGAAVVPGRLRRGLAQAGAERHHRAEPARRRRDRRSRHRRPGRTMCSGAPGHRRPAYRPEPPAQRLDWVAAPGRVENVLGAADGRGRVKVHDLESMLRYCSASI